MKNYRVGILSLLVTLVSFAPVPEAFAGRHDSATEVFQGGKRKKSGRYKKKTGFFKRLFRGKNACDCPKHK